MTLKSLFRKLWYLLTLFVVTLIIIVSMLLAGYGQTLNDETPRVFFVLVDETFPFADLWQQSLEDIARYIVGAGNKGMAKGEQLCLIRIDDDGFDETKGDVLIKPDEGKVGEDIRSNSDKQRLKNKIESFKRRPIDRSGADISGVLASAHLLQSQSSQPGRIVIAIFSDLENSKCDPQALRGKRFPEGSKLYWFNAPVINQVRWEAAVARWTSTFRVIGFPDDSMKFWSVAQTRTALQERFGQN